jgi:uncharacterized protein YodC (DUF2158 family)
MDDKVYFQPGDVVILKQAIDRKPKMIVKSIDKVAHGTNAPELLGVTCMWFNMHSELQQARFSTKDLQHAE